MLAQVLLPVLAAITGFAHASNNDDHQLSLDQPVTQEVFDQLDTSARFAKVSYCATLPSFSTGYFKQECPKMKFCSEDQAETEVVEVFRPYIGSGELSGTAVVAVNREKQEVYALFRGSVGLGDWITDFTFPALDYIPVMAKNKEGEIKAHDFGSTADDLAYSVQKFSAQNVTIGASFDDSLVEEFNSKVHSMGQEDVCPGCKAHTGVYTIHSKLFPKVFKAVKPYLDLGYALSITGHSLGGGYAQFAGMEFKYLGYEPRVITYGGLRVGNTELNKWNDKIFNTKAVAADVEYGAKIPYGSFSRVYQASDLVPQLPPFSPFTHSGLAFEIQQISLPQTAEVVHFRGVSDSVKNPTWNFDFKDPVAYLIAVQHVNYFTSLYLPCNDLIEDGLVGGSD